MRDVATFERVPKSRYTHSRTFANQDVPTQATLPTAFSNNGNFRGQYLQAVLKYKFSQHVSGHLWGELLFPGNYYASDQLMTFLRAEVMFTF